MEIQTGTSIIKPWESLLDSPAADKGADQPQGQSLFGSIFKDAVSRVIETQADVEQKQYLLSTGQLDDAHTLPIAEAKASLSVDILITLRNKAVEAYNELMKMNV